MQRRGRGWRNDFFREERVPAAGEELLVYFVKETRGSRPSLFSVAPVEASEGSAWWHSGREPKGLRVPEGDGIY